MNVMLQTLPPIQVIGSSPYPINNNTFAKSNVYVSIYSFLKGKKKKRVFQIPFFFYHFP